MLIISDLVTGEISMPEKKLRDFLTKNSDHTKLDELLKSLNFLKLAVEKKNTKLQHDAVAIYNSTIELASFILAPLNIEWNRKIELNDEMMAEDITLLNRSLKLGIKLIEDETNLTEKDIQEATNLLNSIDEVSKLANKSFHDCEKDMKWRKFTGVLGGLLLNAGLVLMIASIISGIVLGPVGLLLFGISLAAISIGGLAMIIGTINVLPQLQHRKERLGKLHSFHKNVNSNICSSLENNPNIPYQNQNQKKSK
jgi:hypothetical protein